MQDRHLPFPSLQGVDPRTGLPKPRAAWVARREARGDSNPTQMFYAKQGIITEEMAFVAAREDMDPEYVRSEVSKAPSCMPIWLQNTHCPRRSGQAFLSIHAPASSLPFSK
jgi:hypothetical protein